NAAPCPHIQYEFVAMNEVFKPFQQHPCRCMMTRAECLLRVEHDLNIPCLQRHRLPTRPDHNPPADPNRPDRLSPPLIPILIGQFLNTNVSFGQGVRIQCLQGSAQTSAGLHAPLWFWPIEMDDPLFLPSALNHGVSQHTE